jgi:formylglycine-generating enzyme required for sulfatase activity
MLVRALTALLFCALLGPMHALLWAADPVVQNVHVEQRRDGSQLADIVYAVSDADGDTLSIQVEVTADSGATWVPVTEVSGDVGEGVAPGSDRHIVWDLGAEFPQQSGSGYQVRVLARGPLGPGYTREVTTPAGTTHELVGVPAGEFSMGSESGDSDESPVHTVNLAGYYIDKYEVTNGQWNGYAAASGKSSKSEPDDHPVVSVSWNDARDYCAWAGLRLPTEAEWEKAARGTDGRTYPWGEGIDETRANYDRNVASTTPVGSYPSGVSPYGAHDMSGNVWEWVSDWYDNGYYATSPSGNPQGPGSGTYWVLRGGGWSGNATNLRAADRPNVAPSYASSDFGFRCAQEE